MPVSPRLKIIKNRSDIGAGTRGSDMGIDAIEIAAIKAGDDYFNRFPYVDVVTHNETIYDKVNTPSAKRISYVREQCQRLSEAVEATLRSHHFPLILSGDHSSALGAISGVKAFCGPAPLGVIWIDAHADLHSPYTSPSGNVHGMPLAAALNEDNLALQKNDITPLAQGEWEALKNIGTKGAKIAPEHLVFFGVRDTEAEEDALRGRLNIRNYPVFEMRYRGLDVCVQEALQKMHHCPNIYISFDVDSLDCDAVSDGTGTPVPQGFTPEEVSFIIEAVIKTKKTVCLEIVEVNPLLDTKGNKMAETAFQILQSATKALQNLH